ncbi:MAG: DNA polymerase III subunit beta [Bacteroidales bacterium]|nr:DNA polymerase III subunit beta [Bacteroidales bacterium]MDD3432022.1 DNA polymerase III subunit beta [Bacteroidales bacterium]MDD4361735.1 DNA polymerase III subunit beta [Bacteroidales bacterium]MDD4431313.1 DNA polymerase III subunit beta [Bacteroidales bacterium]
MKFIASSTTLLGHLQTISRVINPKNTLPALDNFLFKIKDGQLTVTASDAENTLVTTMELVEADSDGLFSIPAKNMLDSLREIAEQPLHFEFKADSMELNIYYKNGQFNFVAQDGMEYPQMKQLKNKLGEIVMPANLLYRGIASTLFASADDELRPVMNGVVMDIFPDNVTFVASDAHKLAKLTNVSFHGEAPAEGEEAKASTLIIPKKPASVLKNILPKESEEVKIIFDENNALFMMSDYTMLSRLLEGRFPNYNAVIPRNNPYTVLVDRLSFLNALKRVSVCADPANNLIKLEIKSNNILITAQNIDFSTSAEENVECQYDSEPLNLGFKALFLIDIVSNITTPEILLKLADPSRAGLILPSENEEDEELLMLLMPMMINRS